MKCKAALFIFLLASCLYGQAQETPLPVTELLPIASKKAALEGKAVFVIVHASWCGWCRKMDQSMTDDPAVKALFQKAFVVTHITAYESKGKEALENPGAVAFLTKYGGADEGLPFWYIFDAKGTLLADSKMQYNGKEGLSNSGCPASEEEVANFVQVLRKTTTFTEDELGAIARRFRRNE